MGSPLPHELSRCCPLSWDMLSWVQFIAIGSDGFWIFHIRKDGGPLDGISVELEGRGEGGVDG